MSEAERFDAYYGYPSCWANGCHIHTNGEFVLASDYDALAAELARVKAESLRVVPVGEPVLYDEIQDGILFRAEGEVACKNGQRSQYSGEADSWHFSREYKSGVVPITMFSRTAIIQPVRLEAWEASDE